MVAPEPLADAVARLEAAPVALLALGMPRCSACQLLPATLEAIAGARPELEIALVMLATPADWRLREPLLWPRGVRVSPSSVPALALLREGRAVASRAGSGPAHVLDAWIAETLGPPGRPLAADLTEAERAALERTGPRRAQRLAIRGRD
jgi:thioredoxin-like negative regulator of GroEL